MAEAKKLGIKIVGILDTNSDPTGIDYPVPGNDDAIRAIELFASRIADAVTSGKRQHNERFSGSQAEVDFEAAGVNPVADDGQGPEVALKPAGMEMPTPEASATPEAPAATEE